tara:strand:+ start:18990 stop:19265 length:276 start_codon:yes stop_codon:yes gene_type:complete
MNPKIMKSNLLLIERRRLYNKSEQERKIFNFDDKKIIEFAIDCCEFSTQTKDWRYINLAFKVLDSEKIKSEKHRLKQAAEYSFKELKRTVL